MRIILKVITGVAAYFLFCLVGYMVGQQVIDFINCHGEVFNIITLVILILGTIVSTAYVLKRDIRSLSRFRLNDKESWIQLGGTVLLIIVVGFVYFINAPAFLFFAFMVVLLLVPLWLVGKVTLPFWEWIDKKYPPEKEEPQELPIKGEKVAEDGRREGREDAL
ncbi:MAG: hypothetical protein RDU59_12745 [Thermodesulfobacteriota bacterium]|nr:hypothetical protein [Thermodesulfobacteriota bacterium]